MQKINENFLIKSEFNLLICSYLNFIEFHLDNPDNFL